MASHGVNQGSHGVGWYLVPARGCGVVGHPDYLRSEPAPLTDSDSWNSDLLRTENGRRLVPRVRAVAGSPVWAPSVGRHVSRVVFAKKMGCSAHEHRQQVRCAASSRFDRLLMAWSLMVLVIRDQWIFSPKVSHRAEGTHFLDLNRLIRSLSAWDVIRGHGSNLDF